ncbi:uncharacterized protein P884DRAFT_298195 [Thermothelomyces heterothallicus CBS 202.75]|uniref:uncharacterized protein n=1 Tax=Thermothelomyces heterothallicus CBS 202.75 TaxID=1149848 RepID=UPI003744274A
MTGLPENWEWDYDGRRWFYRYKPTGLIQYTFPKPGDEFPEFICDTEEPLDLAPEERLVSQQQIKRRSTLSESQAKQKTATTAQRDRSSSNAVSDSDDGDGPFWLQPDGLMYMGPGAYNDISPLQEEEEGEERGQSEDKTDDKQDVASQTATPPVSSAAATATATTASKVTAGEDAAQPPRSHASPTASADNTPHVVNSLPATTTPELDSVPVTIAPTQQQPAESAVQPAQLPEIPLLDGREVPYDPTGVVAELASESTAQCAEEINPAPVELPSNETMMGNAGPGPASYVNAFHLAPVELPSNEITPARAAGSCAIKQQTLQQEEQVQQQNTQQAAQHLPSRPYMPLRQNSLPQVATTQISNRVPTLTPGKYQPYNPAKPAVLGAATATRQPSAEAQTGQLAYKPSRDLQREIEDTVQLLSKTGYGQETAIPEASGSARPQPSRTSTLPACLPALPYMGARPHLPHSATSEPRCILGSNWGPYFLRMCYTSITLKLSRAATAEAVSQIAATGD